MDMHHLKNSSIVTPDRPVPRPRRRRTEVPVMRRPRTMRIERERGIRDGKLRKRHHARSAAGHATAVGNVCTSAVRLICLVGKNGDHKTSLIILDDIAHLERGRLVDYDFDVGNTRLRGPTRVYVDDLNLDLWNGSPDAGDAL